MTIEELLKLIFIEEKADPENASGKLFRGVFRAVEGGPAIPVTDWYYSPEFVMVKAEENLRAGILDNLKRTQGEEVDLLDDLKEGFDGMTDKAGTLAKAAAGLVGAGLMGLGGGLKDIFGRMFSFKDGKAFLAGREADIKNGLMKLFGGFRDEPELAGPSSAVLEKAVTVLSRTGEEEGIELDELDVLLNNPEHQGEEILKRFLAGSKPEEKAENEEICRWFLTDYYPGLDGAAGADDTYAKSAPLRQRLKALLDDLKAGADEKAVDFGAVGAGVAGLAAGTAGLWDRLKKLFRMDGDKLVAEGRADDITDGLYELFEGFPEAGDKADVNKLALGNAVKAALLGGSGKFEFGDLWKLLFNKDREGEDILRALPEGNEATDLIKWFDRDYYTGLRGLKDATPTYADTEPLRNRIAGLLKRTIDEAEAPAEADKAAGSVLPLAGIGLAGLLGSGLWDKLKNLFAWDGKKLLAKGTPDEITDGLWKLFDGFKDAPEKAEASKLALGNAVKALHNTKSGSFALDDLDTVLSDPDKGAGLLQKAFDGADDKDAKKGLLDWFKDHFYGKKAFTDAEPLRFKLGDFLKQAKDGALPGILPLAAAAPAVKEAVKPEPAKAAVTAPEEPKKSKLPWICGALAIASLPFWAIPYKLNYNLPEEATITDAPTSYKFYQNVELPEATIPGRSFEGWFTDPDLNNKINNIHFSLGSKNLFPKFSEPVKPEGDVPDFDLFRKNTGDLRSLFDGMAADFDKADEATKKAYDDLGARLKALEDLIAKGNLEGDELTKALKELDDISKDLEALKGMTLPSFDLFKNRTGTARSLFDGMAADMENADADTKAKYNALGDRLKALEDLVAKGNLEGDELTKALQEIDDISKDLEALKGLTMPSFDLFKNRTNTTRSLFDGMKADFDKADEAAKAKFNTLGDRLKALEDLIAKGALEGDELDKALKELDDITKALEDLKAGLPAGVPNTSVK